MSGTLYVMSASPPSPDSIGIQNFPKAQRVLPSYRYFDGGHPSASLSASFFGPLPPSSLASPSEANAVLHQGRQISQVCLHVLCAGAYAGHYSQQRTGMIINQKKVGG